MSIRPCSVFHTVHGSLQEWDTAVSISSPLGIMVALIFFPPSGVGRSRHQANSREARPSHLLSFRSPPRVQVATENRGIMKSPGLCTEHGITDLPLSSVRGHLAQVHYCTDGKVGVGKVALHGFPGPMRLCWDENPLLQVSSHTVFP